MRARHVLRILLGAALAGAIVWVVASHTELDPEHIETEVQALGLWTPLGFIAVYSVSAVLFLPALVMALAGGALFGPFWGTLYNLGGAQEPRPPQTTDRRGRGRRLALRRLHPIGTALPV